MMSVAIAVAALVLSLSAFLHGRWRDRRDLFLQIYKHLVSANQQRGRRLLHSMGEKQAQVKDLSEDDYVLINNALASLNVLAFYYQRRYVRRKDVLELWALPVRRALLAGDAFLEHRDALQELPIWPELRAFDKDAGKYLQRIGVIIQKSTLKPGIPEPAEKQSPPQQP
jgi:hypothetical protein